MSEQQRTTTWRVANGLARFAPGAVISMVLFALLTGLYLILNHVGASDGILTPVAGVTAFIGLFATAGSLVLLALAIVWVIDDDL